MRRPRQHDTGGIAGRGETAAGGIAATRSIRWLIKRVDMIIVVDNEQAAAAKAKQKPPGPAASGPADRAETHCPLTEPERASDVAMETCGSPCLSQVYLT